MASGSLPSLTVLTEEDDVPGSKFEREPEEYTVGQLKRWLKCRGFKLSGKRDELLKRVSDCIKSGNHHTLDPSIDDGKWFSAKVLKENAKLQANCSLSSLPFVSSTGWRAFPTKPNNGIYNTQHSQQTARKELLTSNPVVLELSKEKGERKEKETSTSSSRNISSIS